MILFFLRRDRLGSIAASTESIAFFISYLFIIIFRSNIVVVLIAILFIDEASVNTCPRLVKFKKSPVCFGARNNQYGRFTYPRNIFVSSFLFVHRTGSVTCNKKNNTATGGCFPNHHGLVVILTDHQIGILAPAASKVNKYGWYSLSGYTSSSSVLVFCAPQKPHCIFANTEFCLWYGEDLRGFIENDKGGRRCVWCVGLISDLKNLELKNEYICKC